MFIIAAMLASTTPLPLDMNDVYASGYTKRIRPVAHQVVRPKPVVAKRLITLGSHKSELDIIMDRVKRENGLDKKKPKLRLVLIP